MNVSTPPRIPSRAPFLKRFATVFKMAGVSVIILLLLIPLGMIHSVLDERSNRRNEAVAEITSSWGREQSIVGPVLIVPYKYTVKSWKERAGVDGKVEKVEVADTFVANAYFLPAKLAIDGDIKPARLRRGIYQAVVYDGRLDYSVEFNRPDFASLRIDEKDVLWDDAVVTLAIPDLRGVRETLQLRWGSNNVPLLPGSKLKDFSSGVYARVPGLREAAGAVQSHLALSFNGSGGIRFAPVGAQNIVTLASPWPDPSFQGAFLPAERNVSPNGFTATWRPSYYGRDYPQQWTDRDASTALNATTAASSSFGVNFLSGIDAYRNVERAIKYGALFLLLVFAAFFLFEVLAALRIHPFQYAMVGAAFCLFYLGLLSLSEFISFGRAYFAAAAVTALLISFYCWKVLKSGRRALIIAGLLAAIYGFLYVALQLQDYSLLFGTAGLFVVLAIVFYVTRNIDWYTRDQFNLPTQE